MAVRPLRIAIVGGGIGGLVLALALRRRGIEADVYEQAAELREIGAAVALSANATRELERLGLLEGIAAHALEPSELIWRNGRDGSRAAAFPVGQGGCYRARFGAPYFGIHRADLQRVFGDAHGARRLHLGRRLVDLVERCEAMTLAFADGSTIEADLVVGADGVRSRVRRFVAGDDHTRYSGTSAFRGIVPVADLPSLPNPQAIQFWMGSDAHLLHYGIGDAGQHVNFFAVVEGPRTWDHDGWMAPATSEEAVGSFAGWHPAVTEMVGAVAHTVRWGLFVVDPLATWRRGRAVLIGDAAHAMLPHQGQGANTTIEDAVTLAQLLPAHAEEDLGAALGCYEALRRARTRAIQRSSWATNTQLHLADDAAAGRAARLARFPERFGWIHAFDALATASATEQRGPSPIGT